MYESYFGLTGKPFQLNPDPDFFFGSRGHKRAMAYLEYGLHQGEGFIVITGEVGAGKTTLVRNLLRRIPSDSIAAAQIVSTQVDANDLLRLAAAGFGLNGEGLDKSALLLSLERHFLDLDRQGKRALLIVDEAQNLAPQAVEELRMLSNFQVGTRSLVQSFLVGQPEFREIMQRPEMRQLKQRIIASYHLGPLDRAETKSYVEHRLSHVGWRDDPAFESGAFDRIHAHTGGVPRRINALCDRALLATYLGERHLLTPGAIDEAAAELAEELGLQTSEPAAPMGPGKQDADRLAAQGSADPPIDSQMSARIASLEDRVALLEASTNLALGMLKRVLKTLQGARGAGPK